MMNRRRFTGTALASAVAGALKTAVPQTITEPSPERIQSSLPSAISGPPACAQLPHLPPTPSDRVSERLLPGFHSQYVTTSGATIRVMTKGDGPPLLLLHGHPETHLTWHKIAPALAAHHSVVLTDLRGYGDSSKPEGGANHVDYSFRAMAQDQVEVMAHLGHNRFQVAGHDRGGRVAHRMCLDHPDTVEKVALLDIAPTLTMYDGTTKEFATKYVWWFLQIQPAPMPEHLISLDPVYYLRDHLSVQGKTPGAVSPEVMAEYIRCYCCTATIHAVCEDYRAAASIDLDMDRADEAAHRVIQAPVLALWGAKGTVGHLWDLLSTWRKKAKGQVTGDALPCGHLLPEEEPELVLAQFLSFFRS